MIQNKEEYRFWSIGKILGAITFGFLMVVVFEKGNSLGPLDFLNYHDIPPLIIGFLPVFISILCGQLVVALVDYIGSRFNFKD